MFLFWLILIIIAIYVFLQVALPIADAILTMKIKSAERKRAAADRVPKEVAPYVPPPPPPRKPQIEQNQRMHDEIYARDCELGVEFLNKGNKASFTFAISRVGEDNGYHNYYLVHDNDIGNVLTTVYEEQYNTSTERTRDAYVVEMGPVEIGEVSETTYNKIEDRSDPLILLSSISVDGKVRASLFEDAMLYRSFKSYVAGTRHDNRIESINLLKSKDRLVVRPTEFEGEPAAEIWSGFGMIGYVPKKLASEIVERIENGSFRAMTVSQIRKDESSEDKFVDIEISVYT